MSQSDVSASWSILSTPTSSRNSRTSWAHRLQKSLSQSLGMSSRFDDEARGGEMQSSALVILHSPLTGLMRLPDEEEPPFSLKVNECKWREGCSLQLTCREEEDGCAEHPCLVIQRPKGSWTKGRNLDPTAPPPLVWLHDIIGIHPVLDNEKRPLEACILESRFSGPGFFFGKGMTIKTCLRFGVRADLLEFVSAVKSALAIESISSDEVPSLYRVQISRYQRIIESQPALLLIRPSSPRPTQVTIQDPLTMSILLEIWLRDLICVGQRTDAQQLWLEWDTHLEGEAPGMLSLESESVSLMVRAIKAAMQLHLDWGEEVHQQVTESTVAYLRQKVDGDFGSSFMATVSPLSVPVSSPGSNSEPIEVPAAGNSHLPGKDIPASNDDEDDLDDMTDMTEMKSSAFVNFSDLPQTVFLPKLQKKSLKERKFSSLPLPVVRSAATRAQSSSELSIVQEVSDCEDGHMSRSSSLPSRPQEKESPLLRFGADRFSRLSNRARILPRPPSDDEMETNRSSTAGTSTDSTAGRSAGERNSL